MAYRYAAVVLVWPLTVDRIGYVLCRFLERRIQRSTCWVTVRSLVLFETAGKCAKPELYFETARK